jgi:para-nitrobenzyl esterase
VDLKFDLYEPSIDTQARRPLIIYLHGGSFQSGERTDSEAVLFSRYFAKRGYVTASSSYRLGISNLTDPVAYAEAIYRAIQDARSVVRYFRANATQYRIDTSRIYIGGGSAGSIAAIHAAYLQPDYYPNIIDSSKLGGLDSADNIGYSSKVHGVVNAFGAIMDTTWITSNSAPIVSIHGVDDPTVPYKYANFGQFSLFGSYYIHQRALNVGIKTRLQAFANTGHGFLPGDSGKVDTTFRVIRDFLYQLVTGKDTTPTTILHRVLNTNEISIYPNPAHDFITISNNAGLKINSLKLLTLDGKVKAVYSFANILQDNYQIKIPQLPEGVYFLRFENKDGKINTKKLVISR